MPMFQRLEYTNIKRLEKMSCMRRERADDDIVLLCICKEFMSQVRAVPIHKKVTISTSFVFCGELVKMFNPLESDPII